LTRLLFCCLCFLFRDTLSFCHLFCCHCENRLKLFHFVFVIRYMCIVRSNRIETRFIFSYCLIKFWWKYYYNFLRNYCSLLFSHNAWIPLVLKIFSFYDFSNLNLCKRSKFLVCRFWLTLLNWNFFWLYFFYHWLNDNCFFFDNWNFRNRSYNNRCFWQGSLFLLFFLDIITLFSLFLLYLFLGIFNHDLIFLLKLFS